MGEWYILNQERQVVPANVWEWEMWIREDTMRKVIAMYESPEIQISTVFLGLAHGERDGKPVLFETMVFGGDHDGDMDRYCTVDEARKGHKEFLKKYVRGRHGILPTKLA